MFNTLLSNGIQWRYLISGLIVVMIALSFALVKSYYYERGHTDAISEIKNQTQELIEVETAKALIRSKKRHDNSISIIQRHHEQQIDRLKSQAKVEAEIIEVIRYVEKEGLDTNCIHVGSDVVRLLNKANSEASGGSTTNPGRPPHRSF